MNSSLESVLSVAMSNLPPNKTVRLPMFAGNLYPSDPTILAAQIDSALDYARLNSSGETVPYIKSLIVPHDNYKYILSTLADTYHHIEFSKYDLIVFVAPSIEHFNRLAISGYGYFGTPLGNIELNDYVRNELCDEDDDFFISEEGLPKGASIELQLPFLQRTIGKHHPLRIVPILIGNQSVELCNETAMALSEVLLSKKSLLIALNNFNLSAQNTPEIESFLAALKEHDYGTALRIAVMKGERLGSGLGTIAVAARVSHSLGASKFTVLSQTKNSETDKFYLSASYSQ